MATFAENSEDHNEGGIGGCDDVQVAPITESKIDPTALVDFTLRYGTCGCKWNSAVKKMRTQFGATAVVERFWQRYNRMDRQTVKKECDAPDSVFFNDVCINLGELKLRLGLAPKHGFEFISCLHSLNGFEFVYMEPVQLELLFFVLRDIVRDIEMVANDAPNFDDDQNSVLSFMLLRRISRIYPNQYSTIHTPLTMFNNFRTAKRFVQCWPFISRYRNVLAPKKKMHQEFFVEALFAFSEGDKSLLRRHAPKVREFFMYVGGLECNCVSDQALLFSISLKWSEWFYFCARKLREIIPYNKNTI